MPRTNIFLTDDVIVVGFPEVRAQEQEEARRVDRSAGRHELNVLLLSEVRNACMMHVHVHVRP